VYETHYTALGH